MEKKGKRIKRSEEKGMGKWRCQRRGGKSYQKIYKLYKKNEQKP